jgi:hypothetical protein
MLHFFEGRSWAIQISSTLFVLLLMAAHPGEACTAFYVKSGDRILVGNNEDGSNPETRIWTVPAGQGKYGRLYFGFSDLSAQGGINEQGLWFDAFGLPVQTVGKAAGAFYPGDLQDLLMSECGTVDEVIEMLGRFNRSAMTRYQWMFGDQTGKSVIVEGDTLIFPQDPYQIATNFRQSVHPGGKGYECLRYKIASEMLGREAGPDIVHLRAILSATHSEGDDVTLYSYIADLSSGLLYVYHFHNFEQPLVLNVQEMIAKGNQVYALPELFPVTAAAEAFYYRMRSDLARKRAERLFDGFDGSTFPQYPGRYRIVDPQVMTGQTIDLLQGDGCLQLHLNGGGAYLLFPASPTTFSMLSYGGLDFHCRFERGADQSVDALIMESPGLSVRAERIR